MSSEVEEKRLLIKLVPSNLRVNYENVLYDAVKPFDLILKTADSQLWRYIVDAFRNKNIEFSFTLQNIKTIYRSLNLDVIQVY